MVVKKVSRSYLIWTIVLCVLAVAINAYIIMHSCLDASQSTEVSSGIVSLLENIVNTIAPGTVTPENYGAFTNIVRKLVGHFGLFAVSGVLSSLAIYLAFSPMKWSKYYLLIIMSLGFGLLMGITTELIQLNVPGRSGEFRDVLIDFSGYLLGFLIILLIVFLVIRHNQKKQQQIVEDK